MNPLLKYYLIGVGVCWILLKVVRTIDRDESWTGIIISAAVSIASWFGCLFGLTYFIPDSFYKKWITNLEKRKPPKWL